MNRKIARKNLLDVKKVLDKYKISFWLHTGTFLGAIREKNFIKWDHDIDLRIKAHQWKSKAVRSLEKHGFHVRLVRPNYAQNTELVKYFQLTRSDNCPINIAFMYYHKPSNQYITWPRRADNKNSIISASFYKNKKEIKFLGKMFLIPENTHKFLERFYGRGWKKPEKDERFWKIGRKRISLDKYLEYFIRRLK